MLKILVLILCFAGAYTGYYLFTSKTTYDESACELKHMAIKGKISRVVASHELVFYIDTIKHSFSMHFNFDKDSYREIYEVSPGEIYMLPRVGDSIFKQAGSSFVKFKRHNKIFIEELYLNSCK
jgi:hypothetical protein